MDDLGVAAVELLADNTGCRCFAPSPSPPFNLPITKGRGPPQLDGKFQRLPSIQEEYDGQRFVDAIGQK